MFSKAVTLLLLAAHCYAAPQQSGNPEVTDEDLKALVTQGPIPIEKSIRCGLFFAKEEVGLPPIETLFVIKATFDAPECPTEDRVERAVEFCADLWGKISPKLKFKAPALDKKSADKGNTIGDDICKILLEKGVKYAGNKSRRFPNGVPIGFFSNTCGNKDWLDTAKRHTEPVCCDNGKNVDCP